MSDLAPHEEWVEEVHVEIAKVWVLKDYGLWMAEFQAKWEAGREKAKYSVFRYVTWEEERFLAANKAAREDLITHVARFQKKEAFLWKQNGDLYREVVKLRQEIKFLKEM